MKLKFIIAASAALLGATAAQAQSAGSFILNAGWTNVTTQKSSWHNDRNETSIDIKSQNASAFGLSGTYFITDNIAGELALSTLTRINLKVGKDKVGSVEQFSPTLLLKYYFLNAEDKFRPYVGVGVSRVSFRNAQGETDGTLKTSLEFKNKWAPVANAGFTYQFTDQLFGGVSVSYTPLKSGTITVTDTAKKVAGKSNDSLKLNPITTFVSIGYKF